MLQCVVRRQRKHASLRRRQHRRPFTEPYVAHDEIVFEHQSVNGEVLVLRRCFGTSARGGGIVRVSGASPPHCQCHAVDCSWPPRRTTLLRYRAREIQDLAAVDQDLSLVVNETGTSPKAGAESLGFDFAPCKCFYLRKACQGVQRNEVIDDQNCDGGCAKVRRSLGCTAGQRVPLL